MNRKLFTSWRKPRSCNQCLHGNTTTPEPDDGLLIEYSSNSTVHGIRYVFDRNRHWCERLWWCIALSVSLLTCGYFIHKVHTKWEETPVIVTFSEKSTPIWEIPFPAVTICSETKVNRKIANYTDIYLRLKQSMFEPPYNVTDEELRVFHILREVCQRLNTHNMTESDRFSDDMIQQLSEMAPNLFSIVTGVLFRDLMLFDMDQWFETIMTEEGQCYTFNGIQSNELYYNNAITYNPNVDGMKIKNWHPDTGFVDDNPEKENQLYPVRVLGSGLQQSLKIVLVQSVADLDYTCRFPVQGFRMLLHEPGEFPQISEYFIRIPLGQQLLVAVKPNMITTSNGLRHYDPFRRQCYYNNDRKLKFFKIYTQRNCLLECLADLTFSNCKCVHLGHPRDNATPICGPSQYVCYMETKIQLARFNVINSRKKINNIATMCNCLPACTYITYDAEISQSTVDWEKTFQSFEFKTDLSDRYTSSEVTIFFKDLLFTTARRSELFGYSDFVANCGGLLGLFMGMSLLSIAEIIYYFTVRVFCLSKKRKMIKVEANPTLGIVCE